MLLTIRTTHAPAGDLGYLLHKNPARTQSFELAFGQAHVFYPELSDEACTAALLLDIDSVGLVRGRGGPSGEGGALEQYVNDRPYVASSFLSVAIARVLRSAMAGSSKERPELAGMAIPLEVRLAVLPCHGGEAFLRQLFEPLGYTVSAESHELSADHPEWGPSRYYTVTLIATCRLSELLTHLYVLVPVLDDGKHYWVGDEEVEKLLRHGAGWLERHPERDLITRRYLRHQRSLVDEAIRRLSEDAMPEDDAAVQERDAEEQNLERPLSLHQRRLELVAATLKDHGSRRVLDLGCGEGKLLRLLLHDPQFEAIVGMDVAWRSLEVAAERLRLHRMPPKQRERIALLHGSLLYRDNRLAGFDAAAVVEVIEHLDAPRLAAFERTLFEFARPGLIVITTPNAEYNANWPSLPAGAFRHKDHRFEWTREQFASWGSRVAERFGYAVQFRPVGDEDPVLGSPSQMGVFTR
ncbi:MAG TPA: 3' terminal RNA ribose 2'-O-methyltransferase Hen1 [Gemmatimonadales bacterium]|nr:3' terminal RNA ribose 2'-O-methyltransferase Hen1 [Gemmatimonadales bacterium]